MDNEFAMTAAIQAVVEGRSGDPFAVLGRHRLGDAHILRVMAPGARSVVAIARDNPEQVVPLQPFHHGGMFAGPIFAEGSYLLRIQWPDVEQETEDPYSFDLLLGATDLHLLAEGRHREVGSCLGAHTVCVDGIAGVRFAVWAPNARRVSVVGDFNAWDGRQHPMRARHDAGIWELFIPRLGAGSMYKYEILGPLGEKLPLKADPVGWQVEPPPATASIVPDERRLRWSDADWLKRRADTGAHDTAISIYEVHAGSWMHDSMGRPLGWSGLAERLVPYVRDMGFTHIEFMPVMAHPFGGSWGYQPLGQFAPHALLGTPEEFATLIDRCHEAGLGVILDWVPAHFPNDVHGLAMFDGTPLYEHADPREGFHPDWNSLIYNLGRHEVRGFLIGSALHWLERYHVDGLRVDAVASMLYRDYSRAADEWVPNIHGGRENLEAIVFLRELNQAIEERCPGALLVAEESTAWPGVTLATGVGGLGFDYKWNMGWMHDTLRYMGHDPVHRRYHHDDMTFGLIYAFSERFILPLSHDEVVHGKGSLLGKMPGDQWRKFANLRAYFGFMWTHPGKKLLFMGGEFGQEREWNHDTGLDWDLLDDPSHRGIHRLIRDLNRIYRSETTLHAGDCLPEGFRWIVGDDREQSIYVFLRLAGSEAPILVISNFTPVPRHGYRIGVPHAGRWHEILNTDAALYGGSGMGNEGGAFAREIASHGHPASLELTLPPLATLLLRFES